MLGEVTVLTIGAFFYFSAAAAREWGAPVRSFAKAAWLAAAVIIAVRIAVLSEYLPLVQHLPRPWLAFPMALVGRVNVAIELTIARSLASGADGLAFSTPIALLIAATSIPLGFLWAWVRTRPRSRAAI